METTEARKPQVRRQNPLTFYLRTLLYMFMAVVMRVVAFLPLGALLLFPEGSYWRWAALLCPILLIFFILPLRFSFAQALVQPTRERRFSFDKATSVQNYGEKLAESLLHALHLFLWGIPLWATLGAGYYFYQSVDIITLTKALGNLGANAVSICYAVANFFIGIFNGQQLVPAGGIMEGIYVVGGLLALDALILLWGIVRNSAYRYIWALATYLQKNPHAEARRRLRGRRWKQFWVAVLNLVLWVPTLLIVFTTFKGMISDLSKALFACVTTRQLSLPEMTGALNPMIFAFLVCYLPLLPVRRILTAFFATKQTRHGAPAEPVAEPAETQQAVTTTSSGAPEPTLWQPTAALTPNGQTGETEYRPFGEAAPAQRQDKAEQQSWEPVPVYQPYHQTEPVAQPAPAAPAPVMPEPEPAAPAPEPEPVAAAPEPVPAAPAPEPVPVYQPEPVPVYQPEPERVAEPEPEPVPEPMPVYQPEPEPVAPTPAPEPVYRPYRAEPAEAPAPITPVYRYEEPVTNSYAQTAQDAQAAEPEDFFSKAFRPEQTVAADAMTPDETDASAPPANPAAGEDADR